MPHLAHVRPKLRRPGIQAADLRKLPPYLDSLHSLAVLGAATPGPPRLLMAALNQPNLSGALEHKQEAMAGISIPQLALSVLYRLRPWPWLPAKAKALRWREPRPAIYTSARATQPEAGPCHSSHSIASSRLSHHCIHWSGSVLGAFQVSPTAIAWP